MARPISRPPSSKSGSSVPPTRLYRPVPLDSITPRLQDAVIIGEDNNFFRHRGIDYLALAHALGYRRTTLEWSNPRDRTELMAVLPQAWSRRDRLRGASTISQQLAKNLYLSPSRNPLRKLKEAVITWRLEAVLGKRRIMELYLNVVELGDGVFGAEAASQLYFKRSAAELSSEQAAALAGALPFPLRSNPGYRPGRMRWRQDLILRRMRGELVEVPQVEEEDLQPVQTPDSAAVIVDSIPEYPVPDTTLPEPPPADTTALPPDLTAPPPAPADSSTAP
jgi:monofunctional biosynthetic peptidoglycan transglycosylase